MEITKKQQDHNDLIGITGRKEQPDHEGLQYAGNDDAPEVVTKRSSITSPEALSSNEYHGLAGNGYYDYYGGQQNVRAHYGAVLPSESDVSEKQSRKRTILGMRRKVFFWLLAIVILIVIIAAVLGGVLATVLDNSDSTGSSSYMPLSIDKNTGYAAVTVGSALYSYYQDAQGRIIENQNFGGHWSIHGSDVPANAVIATDAQSGSPLASTSWSSQGQTFRQIFYINEKGLLKTSNTTGSQAWPTTYNILPDGYAAIPNSRALSVVSDTDESALNGIRVYFASTDNVLQEIGLDFSGTNANTWNMWATFPGTDLYSGAASVLYCTENHLYVRNGTTARIQQWTWDYADPKQWKRGAQGPTNMLSNADITATGDGQTTDHIFYENAKGVLVRALYFGTSICDFQNIATVASGSKLTSYYDSSSASNGAVVYYRNESDSNAISYTGISRSGQTVLSGTMT